MYVCIHNCYKNYAYHIHVYMQLQTYVLHTWKRLILKMQSIFLMASTSHEGRCSLNVFGCFCYTICLHYGWLRLTYPQKFLQLIPKLLTLPLFTALKINGLIFLVPVKHWLPFLEDVIHLKFTPSWTDRVALSKLERDLFSLPIRLGGIGIVNPCFSCMNQNNSSVAISAPLAPSIKVSVFQLRSYAISTA